jgi:hypothetical protein
MDGTPVSSVLGFGDIDRPIHISVDDGSIVFALEANAASVRLLRCPHL